MGLKKADFSRLGRVADAMHDELLPFMADVIRTDTDPYVPARTMSLATSAFVNEADLQEGRIVYGNTVNSETGEPVNNYAQAQHDGLPGKRRDMHPQATCRWDEASTAANGTAWQAIAKRQAAAIARRTK